MSHRTSLTAAAVAFGLAASTLIGASAAHADDMSDCVTSAAEASNVVCVAYEKAAGTPAKGKVIFWWKLAPSPDNTATALEGGLWLTRSPIAGERPGDAQEPYPNPNSDETCSSGADPRFTGCLTTYVGLRGSLALYFPLSMAGYQYIIHQSNYLTDADGSSSTGSGDSDFTNDVVWAHKAYRYKYKGKSYSSSKCPPRARGNCTPYVNLVLNRDQGSGMPVSPTD